MRHTAGMTAPPRGAGNFCLPVPCCTACALAALGVCASAQAAVLALDAAIGAPGNTVTLSPCT